MRPMGTTIPRATYRRVYQSQDWVIFQKSPQRKTFFAPMFDPHQESVVRVIVRNEARPRRIRSNGTRPLPGLCRTESRR
jgi:hypothetical protein